MAKGRAGKPRHQKIGNLGVDISELSESVGNLREGGQIGISGAEADGRNSGRADTGDVGDATFAEAGVVDKTVDALGEGGIVGIELEGAGLVCGHG